MAKTKSKHRRSSKQRVTSQASSYELGVRRDAAYLYSVERKFTLIAIAVILGMFCLSTVYVLYKKYEIRKIDTPNNENNGNTNASTGGTSGTVNNSSLSSVGSDIMAPKNNGSGDVITNMLNEHISNKASDVITNGIDSVASSFKAPFKSPFLRL